jgi:hypothetical protein
MKILARIVMVLALLTGLGYGSYAFGRYVLSNKLFGNPAGAGAVRTVSRATGQASAVTHHTDWKGAKPRVEVKVLPSDDNGPATVVTSEDNTNSTPDVSTPSITSGVSKSGKRTFDDAPVEYSLGNEGSEGSRRRRRRRRSSSKTSDTPAATARINAGDTSTPSGDGASPAEAATGDRSSISVAADDDSVIKAPRPQVTAKTSSSSESRPRRSRRRRSRSRDRGERTRVESPVPQPENSTPPGDGNNDSADISPVPQPE